MAYSFQTFSVSQVLTAAQMNQVEANVRDHVHGQSSVANWYVGVEDAGASDAYAVTVTPAPGAYVTGMHIVFKANTANTGPATLNVNSLGAKTIKKAHDQDLATNNIEAGAWCLVVYDGTDFQMLSQLSAGITLSDLSKTTGSFDPGGAAAHFAVNQYAFGSPTSTGSTATVDGLATNTGRNWHTPAAAAGVITWDYLT